jgi:hypothetical protein
MIASISAYINKMDELIKEASEVSNTSTYMLYLRITLVVKKQRVYQYLFFS